MNGIRALAAGLLVCFTSCTLALAQINEAGIPVTEPLVIAKCGACHARDSLGNMERISWERTTPEGWQEALKRMVLEHGLSLAPAEAHDIVKYLSADHGLAPEEAKAVLYDAERRVRRETNIPDEALEHGCARCHTFARALSWRRSAADWKQIIEWHTQRFKLPPNEEALAYLAKVAPLHTPEWDAWSKRAHSANLRGMWLVTASMRGHGKFYGKMRVAGPGDDEFTTNLELTSLKDGSSITRSGRGVVYGANAWRGRSKGVEAADAAPDNLSSDAREVLWIAPDHLAAEGRWFWGQYQEFGLDVRMRRADAGPALLLVDRSALKTGSEANRIRLIGDRLPASVTPADLDLGPGIHVRRIVSSTASEVVAEVDVDPEAPLGKRDVVLAQLMLPRAVAVYDRVDYIKVEPDSGMAAFGDPAHSPGYQQFDAIAYANGPDGRPHTPDDVDLGPMDPADVAWSLEVFYQTGATDLIGKINSTGFFTPAAENPKANFDVWVIATDRKETNKNGGPLSGKSYMVLTVPAYTLNGRQYVRDLDRWVDNGPAQ
jgi:quinohemoprotein amine dehydrogenase